MKDFVNAVAREVQVEHLGIAVNHEAQEVLRELGPRWLAAALAPTLLLRRGAKCRFDIRLQAFEPMESGKAARKNPRAGSIVVGSGEDFSQPEIILLPSLEVLRGQTDFAFGRHGTRVGELIAATYTRLYRDTPLLLDSYRQWRNSSGGVSNTLEGTSYASTAAESSSTGRVMWIAMHWAEAGGAESWAWEQAQIAHAAGFELVFTFDRAAPQRQLDRAFALSEHVYLVGNGLRQRYWESFASALVTRHRITHLHIHHSALAYGNLLPLRLEFPGLHVEDSTHIYEHRSGGFVTDSLSHSELIDSHHVISPQLVNIYRHAGVPEEKIIFRPLTNFTLDSHEKGRTSYTGDRPLTVGFMGRLSAQKRPYLFQRIAWAMKTMHPKKARFIMQGDGELARMVDRDEKRLGLTSLIQRRPWGPSAALMADIDVLLITSDNEGLTLTTLEADAAGVLVVSTDVGSQASVIADEALLPSFPTACVRRAVPLLARLAADPTFFNRLLAEQNDKVEQIRSCESASAYFASHYAQEKVQ